VKKDYNKNDKTSNDTHKNIAPEEVAKGGILMPPKISYSKPHLSIIEQIEKLKLKGIIFNNRKEAIVSLSHISYFRLKFYILSNKYNRFEQDILRFYSFDKELRNLILEAIEFIEISLRTQICFHLTKEYGSHPHLDSTLFNNKYSNNIKELKKEYNRSKDNFIRHFKKKYKEELPPLWVIIELISFGQLYRWFNSIKIRRIKKYISKVYNFANDDIFASYFYNLTIIRNTSAHHSRLWNRKFTFTSRIDVKKPIEFAKSINKKTPKNIYNILVFIQYMLIQIELQFNFKEKLDSLINDYQIETFRMGFPNNWQNLPVWSEKE